VGAHPPFRRFELQHTSLVGRLADRVSICWLQALQCYAELDVYSLAVAVTIANTHFAYIRMDGQAELA